jgi:hypothetical protein
MRLQQLENEMSTDRELLELAGKAAGYHLCTRNDGAVSIDMINEWNPRTSDSDSRRLQVALSIVLFFDGLGAYCNHSQTRQVSVYFTEAPDHYDAARLAVLRAAAEIGRAMP